MSITTFPQASTVKPRLEYELKEKQIVRINDYTVIELSDAHILLYQKPTFSQISNGCKPGSIILAGLH